MTKPGVRWAEFSDEACELARGIAGLIEQHGFALIGTIRRDGTPRISAVETHLVRDHLILVMIPKTRKASDIRGDDRITLQSPVFDAAAPGAEYKLHGRAVIVDDEDIRGAASRAIEARSGWKPEESWLFLSVLVGEASHLAWRPDGSCHLRKWKRGEGVESQVLRLDPGFGGYRSN